jgi:hypothetical protein
MLTLNADVHPLMSRIHRLVPELGPDQQYKRSVIAIEPSDTDQWLLGTADVAQALVRLPPLEVIEAGPA